MTERDPFSAVVDEQRKMVPDWYSWLLELDRRIVPPTTAAGLPAAAGREGAIGFVRDATVTTQNTVVAGGGANKVLVFSDGTNWRIA